MELNSSWMSREGKGRQACVMLIMAERLELSCGASQLAAEPCQRNRLGAVPGEDTLGGVDAAPAVGAPDLDAGPG